MIEDAKRNILCALGGILFNAPRGKRQEQLIDAIAEDLKSAYRLVEEFDATADD